MFSEIATNGPLLRFCNQRALLTNSWGLTIHDSHSARRTLNADADIQAFSPTSEFHIPAAPGSLASKRLQFALPILLEHDHFDN